jgi:hypothetical protein
MLPKMKVLCGKTIHLEDISDSVLAKAIRGNKAELRTYLLLAPLRFDSKEFLDIGKKHKSHFILKAIDNLLAEFPMITVFCRWDMPCEKVKINKIKITSKEFQTIFPNIQMDVKYQIMSESVRFGHRASRVK